MGLPHFRLLGLEADDVDGAWTAWDAAQTASDATPLGRRVRPLGRRVRPLGRRVRPLGRRVRPLVVLVPAGGRWITARSIGRSCLLEALDHPTPVAALRAAETMFRLIVAGRTREEVAPQPRAGATGAEGGGDAPGPGTGEPGSAQPGLLMAALTDGRLAHPARAERLGAENPPAAGGTGNGRLH